MQKNIHFCTSKCKNSNLHFLDAENVRRQGIELLNEVSKLKTEIEENDCSNPNDTKAFVKAISKLEKKIAQKLVK